MSQKSFELLMHQIIEQWLGLTPNYWYWAIISGSIMSFVLFFSIVLDAKKIKNISWVKVLTCCFFISQTLSIYLERPNSNLFFCDALEKELNIKIKNESGCIFTKNDYRKFKTMGLETFAKMKKISILEENKN